MVQTYRAVFVFLGLLGLTLSGCGRENPALTESEESQAFQTLSENLNSGRGAFGGSGNLNSILSKFKFPTSSTLNTQSLQGLGEILKGIQSGQATNTQSLANLLKEKFPQFTTPAGNGASAATNLQTWLKQWQTQISQGQSSAQLNAIRDELLKILPSVYAKLNAMGIPTPSPRPSGAPMPSPGANLQSWLQELQKKFKKPNSN